MDQGRSRLRAGRNKKVTVLSGHPYPDLGAANSAATSLASAATGSGQAYSTVSRSAGSEKSSDFTFPHNSFTSLSIDAQSRITPRRERPSRQSSFTYPSSESPSDRPSVMASIEPGSRKRARNADVALDGVGDEVAHDKGGHQLRKRPRIDYTHIEDKLSGRHVPTRQDSGNKSATASTARGKKRRATQGLSDEESDELATNPKRRRSEKSPVAARTSTTRPKKAARKGAADAQTWVDDNQSENDVQDTILVGVPMNEDSGASDEDESSARSSEPSDSDPSSPDAGEVRDEAQPAEPEGQTVGPVEAVTVTIGPMNRTVDEAADIAVFGDAATSPDLLGQKEEEQPAEKGHLTPNSQVDGYPQSSTKVEEPAELLPEQELPVAEPIEKPTESTAESVAVGGGKVTSNEGLIAFPTPILDAEIQTKLLAEPSQHPEFAASAKPTAIETNQLEEAVEPTETTETSQHSETLNTTKPTELTEPTEPTESTRPTEITEATESAEPVKPTEPTEVAETTGITDSKNPTETHDMTIESLESAESTDATEIAGATKPVQAVATIESVETTKFAAATDPEEATETTRPGGTATSEGLAKPAEIAEIAGLVEPSEPAQKTEPVTTQERQSLPPTLTLSQVDGAADEKTPQPILSSTESPQSHIHYPKQRGRIRQIAKLYAAHEKDMRKGLSPYEAEKVTHPSTYTEWIQPQEQSNAEISSTFSTSLPPVSTLGEKTWDGKTRLKLGQLTALFRQEALRRESSGEPQISMKEYYNQCCRVYKAAQRAAVSGDSTCESSRSVQKVDGKLGKSQANHLKPNGQEEGSQETQALDSQQPTAAPSPEHIPESTDPQVLDQSEAARDETPSGPVEVTRVPQKQYEFLKLRDPAEFIEALKDYGRMDIATLYQKLAAVAESLNVWQQEYHELRKIVDDEENAKRRALYDKTLANWENRQKLDEPPQWRRHFDEPIKGPQPFEIRGVRATKPYADDPILEHQREEDRIMAQAYGFKYNPNVNAIGKQNPEDQRWEMMPETRLRERKQTQKAADLAEENVIEGKRMRKPRVLSDHSKEPSRASTPIAPPQRRRRNIAATLAAEEVDAADHAESNGLEEATKRRRGTRTRGMVSAAQDDATPTGARDDLPTPDEAVDDKHKVMRKRARGANAQAETQPAHTENGEVEQENEDVVGRRPKRLRNNKDGLDRGTSGEIPPSSFYNNQSADAMPGPRPSTSSSSNTAHTADTIESTYALRDKPRRNFVTENDPELETRTKKQYRAKATKSEAKKLETKTATRSNITRTARKLAPQQPREQHPLPDDAAVPIMWSGWNEDAWAYGIPGEQLPPPGLRTLTPVSDAVIRGPFISNAAPPLAPGPGPVTLIAPAGKKKITKLKITNANGGSRGSSRAATPIIAPNPIIKGRTADVSADTAQLEADDNELAKPYSEMSKSEKMSYSMRRRWAAGEMKGAVEKRKSTLAKKAEAKASGSADPDPQQSEQQPEQQQQQAMKRARSKAAVSTGRGESSSVEPSGSITPIPTPPLPGASLQAKFLKPSPVVLQGLPLPPAPKPHMQHHQLHSPSLVQQQPPQFHQHTMGGGYPPTPAPPLPPPSSFYGYDV